MAQTVRAASSMAKLVESAATKPASEKTMRPRRSARLRDRRSLISPAKGATTASAMP